MNTGLQMRMDRLFNRRNDGRAVCVAADHGYMSDVTANVVRLRQITEAVIRGGVDGILMSPGQAMRLAPLYQGKDGPALIVRADWMNMPRLGSSNVTNAVPQKRLFHQKVLTAEQALSLGATAITIYLFLGYNDAMEASGIESAARFVSECHKVGLPCIMEPLAFGPHATGAATVEILTLGARICVELGADALKIPYTGDVESFAHLVHVSQVPVLVLGGARSDNERDALELFAEGLEAGCHGCLMGRNVTKSPDPEKLIRQMTQVAHDGYTVDEAMRGRKWEKVRLKAAPAKCTGCELCVTACSGAHDTGEFGTHNARLHIDTPQLGQHKIMFCTLCKKCIDVCPTQALQWHEQTGAVQLLVERCTACDRCVDVCPTKVIARSEEAATIRSTGGILVLPWYPVICDLCAADPACAKICPTGAIYVDERLKVS
jgi:DhnA family fructose-bisphosphate aldolase class Ia/Fe-S-cluster-containing hydrogenase component 2